MAPDVAAGDPEMIGDGEGVTLAAASVFRVPAMMAARTGAFLV
jgi:hypothetical protein